MRIVMTISLTVIFVNGFCQLQAQDVVSTGGDYFSNNDIAIAWTMGEVISESLEGPTITLTQGFHQSGLVATGIQHHSKTLNIQVYPNPTAEILHLKSEIAGQLYAEIRSMDGKVWMQSIIHATDPLNLGHLPNGIYLLVIRDQGFGSKSVFEITKTH